MNPGGGEHADLLFEDLGVSFVVGRITLVAGIDVFQLLVPVIVHPRGAGAAAAVDVQLHAAGDQAAGQASSGLVWLIILSPLLLLFVFLAIFTRKSGAMKQGDYLAKSGEFMDRSVEHMASIERKTDRMIELLESIDRRLSEGA